MLWPGGSRIRWPSSSAPGSIGDGWGNGKAVAVALARAGAKVVAVDVNQAAAVATETIIRDEGGTALAAEADATSLDAITRCVDRALSAIRAHRHPAQQCRHHLPGRPGRDQRGDLGQGHDRQRQEHVPDMQGDFADHGSPGPRRDRQYRRARRRALDRLGLLRLCRQQGAR